MPGSKPTAHIEDRYWTGAFDLERHPLGFLIAGPYYEEKRGSFPNGKCSRGEGERLVPRSSRRSGHALPRPTPGCRAVS